MCRNCPLPQWSEPIEVEVSSLPPYFAKEQSWNFERLNFGNGTIIDTKDGKSARPSITGLVGTRLRDGFALKPHPRFPGGRYLLVSECLYCPGRRYGCTARENCSGKRRFCCALCKISIFADKPNNAFVYYSGSHGAGNVSASDRHRPNKQMLDELRRLRVEEGLTPSQGFDWCKSYFTEHGWDEKQMPTKQQIKSLMKRASKTFRMRDTKTEIKALAGFSSPAASTVTTSQQSIEGINAAYNMKYSQLIAYPENVEMSNEAGSSTYISDGAATNVPSVFNPGSTPLAILPRMSGTSLLNSPIGTSGENKGIVGFLTGQRATMDVEKDNNVDKVKEFVRILQDENFNRISQIADLQVEVNVLKNTVIELKEDNLKKAIHIAQLERERRAEQCLSNEVSTGNSEQSQRTQEPIPETLIENHEETVVIESIVATPMEVCNQPDQSDNSFQEAVCDTPMSVSVQTSSTSPIPEVIEQSAPIQSPVIVAQAIIVSEAARASEDEIA